MDYRDGMGGNISEIGLPTPGVDQILSLKCHSTAYDRRITRSIGIIWSA